MTKTGKRILCGALALGMTSSLVLERALAQTATPTGITTTAKATFKDITGRFDTSNLRESYMSDSVFKSEDVAPTYETRTVIVTLTGKTLVESANGGNVTEYLSSYQGEKAAEKISIEQDRFLTALTQENIDYELVRSYNTVLNGVAIEVDTEYVSYIKGMSGVESVVITTSYSEPATATVQAEGDGLVTNETNVYKTGIYDSSEYTDVYGEGMVVAILDTGLDYTHHAFQGFESEHVETRWKKQDVKALLDSKNLNAEEKTSGLEVSDVYMSDKVPYAYDYADDDADVYPSYSNHGTHVAGIIGGYDTNGYTDKDGNPVNETFKGVVPDAQLAIFKVFTDDLDDPDLGGAVAEDIVAALDDCVKLGVDVINMSLGTSGGFTTTNDGDDEGELLNAVYESIKTAGISLICAASNDYSAGYGGVYGTNLASNPDSGTVGSPSTFSAALSVASVNGQKASYMIANEGADNQAYVFYEESRDINSNPFDFYKSLTEKYPEHNGEFEYVVVPGVGLSADYTSTIKSKVKGRIALIKRGDSTFQEKVEIAMQMGAIGVIIYNNVAGTIRMNLGEIEDPIPAVSINMNAGNAMVAGATNRVGTIRISDEQKAGPFMSEFSSWGPTHDLRLKPEITAHGGEITSTVPGGYGEQSGTSMACPNMAGFIAIVRSYIQKDLGITDPVEVNRRAMQLVMSTATTAYDQDGHAYSPRKQGAGLARMEKVVSETTAYLWADVAENDYRPKLELFDDKDKTGVYEMSFNVTNFGESALTFSTDQLVMTETLSSDNLTVSEQSYLLDKGTTVWKDGNTEIGEVKVEAGETKTLHVTITLADSEKAYIEKSFENGMYVEGYLKLRSKTDGQCDLSIPFLAFYGDWAQAPMLDYTAFEVADCEQDASVKEEDKIKASVWETLPYTCYYNEKYIIPMGGYVYLLDDNDEPVYVDEDKCAVSRYNIYYGEGNNENYMTSTAIKAVYAGLLRNARIVKYRLYDEATGELVLEDQCERVSKAYAGGGSAVPANVEINLSPEAEGLIANGKYRLEFDFFMDSDATIDGAGNKIYPDRASNEENTFEFSFTVDYEAPILQDVRVRYYNYKDGNKVKQRIYLDMDVYDNHYAQALMLCYPTVDSNGKTSVMLATDYPTPIRDAKPNGTTTVSLEITDIYEKYGNMLYLQLDDYALNTCLYQINIDDANQGQIGDVEDFDFVTDEKLTKDTFGDGELTLNIYETYKVGLTNVGNGDASNFVWTSDSKAIAGVKNGEIVGLAPGETTIIVSTGAGTPKLIHVTVTESQADIASVPSLSFGVIKTNQGALSTSSVVKVNAGENFQIPVLTDPWYHPMTNLRLVWSSTNERVATVDQNGNVATLKKGTAIILAQIERKNGSGQWEQTLYSCSVTLRVQNEFTVSNFTLIEYNGVGGVVEIPKDLNVMYIGEEAFKDNNNITKLIIPSTVVDIKARAFENCTALEEVYFVSERHREDGATDTSGELIDWAELSMIYENAFSGCIHLKKIDFSNVKTITVAMEAFSNCPNLSEVVDMPSIGTMHHYAFAGTALTSVDLTGLHMSGNFVFANCENLTEIKTGKFTAIGNYMFSGCTALREEITLSTPKIGNGAFSDCVNLSGVIFDDLGEDIEYAIGANAFANCGKNVGNFTMSYTDGEKIRAIGDRAFAGSAIKTFPIPAGLEVLGGDVFANTAVTTLVIDNNVDIENLRIVGIPFKSMTLALAETNVDRYALENGVLYNAAKTKLLHVNPSVTEVVLPESVTEIGAYALAGGNVKKITLTSNVTKLGVGAFMNSALSEIVWKGATLSEIPENAFRNTYLSSIVLPDGVTKIGAYAFAESGINDITAKGVTEIGSYAFMNCTALRGVQVEGRYTLTLSENLTKLGDGVFQGCTSLMKVVLPSLEEVGGFTFRGASNLKSVIYGDETKSIGSYAFYQTNVEEVTLGSAIEVIDEGAFYDCEALTAITLPESVKEVKAFAFKLCNELTTVNGIGNVEIFGNESFYNVPFESLNLENAVTVGIGAFAMEKAAQSDGERTLDLPNAVTIGDYAFNRSGFKTVNLSASLEKVGGGAFAEMRNLTTFTAEGNFFVEDGVLYRNVNVEDTAYELVCYPAALVGSGESGERSYAVKEGTLRVNAYAFNGLNKGMLNKVVLPYTINAIGDGAFLNSGVKEYTFESIQAPVLETIFRQDIADAIEAASSVAYYKGYYYANFETYLFNFTEYVREKSDLIMHYPANGTGYDNYIYSLYFGVKKVGDVLPEDDTRIFLSMMESFPDASEIEAWTTETTTKEEVEAFAGEVKTARRYYNNASKKAAQATFVEEYTERLMAIEGALRAVKPIFGIEIKLSEIRVAEDSTHRTTYVVGETFDMTGLKIELVYDDESTMIADSDKIVLWTTKKLGKLDKLVTVEYEGETLSIRIDVEETNSGDGTGDSSTPDEDSSSEEGNSSTSSEERSCKSAIGGATALLTLLAAGAVCVKGKKDE